MSRFVRKHTAAENVTMRRDVRTLLAIGTGIGVGFLALPAEAWAEEASAAAPAKIDGADTAFMMICAALVMLMTPGLGLFYGGMVRRKNVLATFQQSFIMLGVVALQWVVIGYSLAFGPDAYGGLVGGLNFVGLNNVGLEPNADYAATI